MRSKALLVPTIVVFVAVVIMLRLGWWQLERSEYKQQRLLQIEQRKQLQPYSLDEVLAMERDIRDLPLKITGKTLKQQLLLLDNRIYQGKVGYEILLPVLTDQGVLLVNLGWVKAGQYRHQLPDINLRELGSVFTGVVSQPSLNPVVTETTGDDQPWPRLIQQIDTQLFESWFIQPLLPFVLLAEEGSNDFEQNWQAVVMPPEKHIAYAIQWFGLALACALVYLVAVVKTRKKDDR